MIDTRAVLTHAWKMIIADRSTTLRLVLLPWLVMFLGSYGPNFAEFGYFFGDVHYDPDLFNPDSDIPEGDGYGLWHLAGGIVSIVAWIWLAVSWHRYVLEGDAPIGWIPQWAPSRNLNYLKKGILAALPLIPVFIVAIILAIGIGDDEVFAGGPEYAFSRGRILFGFLIGTIVLYVTFRFGPVLPAAAMDRSIGLRDAWRMTAPLGGVLVNLAIIGSLLYVPATVLTNLFAANNPLFFIFLAAGDFVSLITLSVLTVLYGHLVQGRDLPT